MTAAHAANSPEPLIAARLTAPGRSAVAVVAVAGAGVTSILAARFFSPRGAPLEETPPQGIRVGRWGGAQGEEVVIRRRGAEEWEICCHGGEAAVAAIWEELLRAGCRPIDWRAWLERDDDPFVMEARLALAEARTERGVNILLDQLRGALGVELARIDADLAAGDRAAARRRIAVLRERIPAGRRAVAPGQVVLAGRPNVGKSSLINALVGYERAIVLDAPGTTRDIVTASTAIDGWPVTLSDTAGLRATDDPLEAAGVELARRQLESADVVVLVFDGTRPWSRDDRMLLDQWPTAIVVHTKRDLVESMSRRPDDRATAESISSAAPRPEGIATSAVTGAGVAELLAQIARRLVPLVPAAGSAVPFTARHEALLDEYLRRAE